MISRDSIPQTTEALDNSTPAPEATDVRLVKYDAACKAIAEAKTTDEVRHIRDVSVAMRAYARQANNHEMEADAIEIRMRATRRMDQLRQQQKATMGLNKGGGDHRVRKKPGAPPTLAEAGINKNLAHEGRKLGAMNQPQFERAVAAAREATNKLVKDVISGATKKLTRSEREEQLGRQQRALPESRYGVTYADPPWHFAPRSDETGMDRSAENHYPTMNLESICALSVPAAEDAALFLWATAPMLPQALQVMAAWGFTYKSQFVWVKDKAGTGYWNRNQHELLLVGTRGNVPAPAPGEQLASVIYAPRTEHSAKPAEFRKMIEKMFPALPRIELFAREQAEGWASWGKEIQEAAE